jgi:hypothetical protein
MTRLLIFLVCSQLLYALYVPYQLDLDDDEVIFYFGRRNFMIPDNATDDSLVWKQSPESFPEE